MGVYPNIKSWHVHVHTVGILGVGGPTHVDCVELCDYLWDLNVSYTHICL